MKIVLKIPLEHRLIKKWIFKSFDKDKQLWLCIPTKWIAFPEAQAFKQWVIKSE